MENQPNFKEAIVITDEHQAVKRYQSKCKVIWIGGNKTNSKVISLDARHSNRILADEIISLMERKNKTQIICVGERGKEVATKMTDLQAIRHAMEGNNEYIYHRNFKDNIELIRKSPGVISLMNKHKDKIGIVAAAGPSLKHVINTIKNNRDKFVIFTAGSANISLRENGIIPEYLCMLDPFSMEEHKIENKSKWFGDIHPDTTILSAYTAHYDSIKNHNNIMFWVSNFENKVLEIKDCPQTVIFNINISVSVNALYFADFCGCRKIVLCGQDCGKKEGSSDHAWGNDGYFERTGQYRYLTGWDGEKNIITDLTYEELHDWLEYVAPTLNCKQLYNTSIDGSFIKGFIHKPIEEVLD